MDEIGKDAPSKQRSKNALRSFAECMTSAIADLLDVNYAPLDIA
jgi:hypothetical protein